MNKLIQVIRASIRVFTFFIWAIVSTAIVFSIRFLGGGLSAMFRYFGIWKNTTNWFMGVEVEFQGNIPSEPAIIMPNHRSYIDVTLLPSKIPLVYVAKAEVKKWPVIGWGADSMKTVWVDRNNADSRRHTREQIKKRLEDNQSVIVFPEGTTYAGPEALELKPGMFYIVAEGKFKVIPVAIEYQFVKDAWVGTDTFIPHFVSTFGKRKTKVKVRFGEPLWNEDGEKLRQEVHAWMNKNLVEMRQEWNKAS